MSDSSGWILTLACNRADAESLPESGDIFPDFADPPSINVEEPDPDRPDAWVVTAYFNEKPGAEQSARITALFPSATGIAIAPLADADWTTLSQRNLEPVRAGRFLVHTKAHAAARRPGDIAIAIEAGLAFGTGQHATTHGCLEALDALAKRRQFQSIADLGTGTGVLALAAARRWKKAATIASDIDPVAVAVSRANLRGNRVGEGRAAARIELVRAAGLAHRRLAGRAPYDLVIANILAGPLIDISLVVGRAVAPGGVIILAGLLQSQAVRVRAAYRRHGLIPVRQHRRGEWPCLVLTRPRLKARGTAGYRPPAG